MSDGFQVERQERLAIQVTFLFLSPSWLKTFVLEIRHRSRDYVRAVAFQEMSILTFFFLDKCHNTTPSPYPKKTNRENVPSITYILLCMSVRTNRRIPAPLPASRDVGSLFLVPRILLPFSFLAGRMPSTNTSRRPRGSSQHRKPKRTEFRPRGKREERRRSARIAVQKPSRVARTGNHRSLLPSPPLPLPSSFPRSWRRLPPQNPCPITYQVWYQALLAR